MLNLNLTDKMNQFSPTSELDILKWIMLNPLLIAWPHLLVKQVGFKTKFMDSTAATQLLAILGIVFLPQFNEVNQRI